MQLAFGFLNPLFLWALPLAAVPIIIHLLNRRRFDRRPWAAMEFLLAAMKRNRRRLRMEQWLILLLRTLAILLLVLLVARPHLQGSVLGGRVAHHVLLVDDSASMAHRGGADAAFDRGIEAVRALVTRLADQRPGDLLTVLRSSAIDTPELSAVPIGPNTPGRIREATAAWQVGDGALDPGLALAAARRLAEASENAGETEYHVVTDMRRRDWIDAASGELRDAPRAWFAALDEGQHVTFVDVGATDANNLAVTAIRATDRSLVAGVPTGLSIEVRNQGPTATTPTEVTLQVEGGSRVVRPVGALQPGESARIEIEQTFTSAGPQGVTARLPGDRYGPDDLRSLALDVRPAARVLLIDGDPGTDEEDQEIFYLQSVLDPDAEFVTGVELRVGDERQFAAIDAAELRDTDLICLCNVARPDDAMVAKLEEYVAGGGGLALFLGDQIDVARYQTALWKAGRGLLPAALVDVAGDVDDPEPVYLADEDHPVLATATDLLRFLFAEQTRLGRWFELLPGDEAPCDVLLRVRDADGSPLLVARQYTAGGTDAGEVYLLATTADAQWHNMQGLPVFPILISQLQAHATRAQTPGVRNLDPDGVLTVRVDPARHRPDVAVAPTSAPDDVVTFAGTVGEGSAGDGSGAPTDPLDVAVPMRALQGYGLFEVRRELHAGGAEREYVARNPLLAEGELEPLSAGTLRSTLPDSAQERVTIVRAADGAAAVRDLSAQSSLWRWLGLLMVVGMLLETVLAWRFGRR